MNLSKNHIIYTLGVPAPLNKSIQLNESLVIKILHEQLLYETFLDSIKSYASEKYGQVITTIKDWKDAAAVLGKVLSSGELLNDFLKPLQRRVEKLILPLTDFLKKLKLDSFVETIKKILTKINSLEGWKKFMGLVSIGSIITYILEKLKSSGPDAVKNILSNVLSPDFVNDIGAKLIDFKSYLGWLQPIVKGVEIIFNFLKPLIDAFAQAFKSGGKLATKIIKENTMNKLKLKQIVTNILKEENVSSNVINISKDLEDRAGDFKQIRSMDKITQLFDVIVMDLGPDVVKSSNFKTALRNFYNKYK
jgi:hypothetical protein